MNPAGFDVHFRYYRGSVSDAMKEHHSLGGG